MVSRLFLSAIALSLAFPLPALAEGDPIVIAHRGASGERPEHTLAAYELAIEQGADYIEPDLVVTKDLVLVSRHENELSGTTDVASREEFEDRRRDKMIDGQRIAGWFAEDFTLAELRTLRAKERVPNARPGNVRYDGLYQVPTLAEIVKLKRAKEAETGRSIGLYPELKHPTFLLEEAGIDVVDLLLRELRDLGIGPEDPIYIQSFEVGVLQRLNRRSDYKLVQLIRDEGGPADEPDMRYSEMISPSGLEEITAYADAIGPWLGHVVRPDGSITSLVADAKKVGLKVHPWTLRKENGFLPAALQGSGGPSADGGYRALWRAAISSGADGFFTDNVKEFVELARQAND
ncbi:glycerophosphodiester phosphodiesterase family protein [Erythrobacter sp. THAF29]|uniref:glycerophosphodiester phosphodiesterase family protein n=1 Tax=Erythrobacter sp. THAF29 TaxID=2587851 RepID=UPI001268D1E5|nr:glycerophosphodiester phosphodiesterase family protein [Erythrobacter sp. THAF29]QFT76029.1 Glycerophosphoryl diester phosphodiesterase precursor [Erythrobacter sp. THAF29]